MSLPGGVPLDSWSSTPSPLVSFLLWHELFAWGHAHWSSCWLDVRRRVLELAGLSPLLHQYTHGQAVLNFYRDLREVIGPRANEDIKTGETALPGTVRFQLRSNTQVSQSIGPKTRWPCDSPVLNFRMTTLIEEADVFEDENSTYQRELEVRRWRFLGNICLRTILLSAQPSFGILFDIDGVIARGLNPLPIALDMISLLKGPDGEVKVPMAFVTNACNKSAQKAKQISKWMKCDVSLG